jgi:hypothetical protein
MTCSSISSSYRFHTLTSADHFGVAFHIPWLLYRFEQDFVDAIHKHYGAGDNLVQIDIDAWN